MAANVPATSMKTTVTTMVTAAQRGSLRLTSHDTAVSSPSAKNIATPINTNTDDIDPRTRTAPYVSATPADAVNPTTNGERRLNRVICQREGTTVS